MSEKHPKPRPFWNRTFSYAHPTWTRTMEKDASNGDDIKPDWNSIMPHSKEAGFGDEIYAHTGDAYANEWPSELEWQLHEEREYPYLQHVKELSMSWPHLRFLAQWMEVTTSPIKWTQFKDMGPRKDFYMRERARRTKVAVLDFVEDGNTELVTTIKDSDTLRSFLQADDQPKGVSRLYIVEDLSRDMIESFGWYLDIDPLFFREHINDYWWYNTRDPWVELPDLDIISKERDFFRLSYVQPRYFKDKASFLEAKSEAGKFNVLRRLDDDSEHKALFDSDNAIVALVRSKMSLWTKPRQPKNQKGDFTAVLLVDPSITAGHALWKGYRPFRNSPTPKQAKPSYPGQPKDRLFDDLIFWIRNMRPEDVQSVSNNPNVMLFRMTQIICSDWNILIRYIMARLGQIEWELERPDFRPDSNKIDASLAKLHTWRRRLPLYKTMVRETQDKLFRGVKKGQKDCIAQMRKDFRTVALGLDELYARTERIATVATAVTSIEESRRAMVQNRALGRLTYLAVIFAPLSFISSFFSMTPELSELTTTIWIYFAVALPVSAIAFLLVEPSVLAWIRSFLPGQKGKKK